MENQNPQSYQQWMQLNHDITTWALPDGALARLGQGGMWCTWAGKPAMAYSPDGRYLVVRDTIGLWWYDVSHRMPAGLSGTERGMISAAAFSPNGKWFAFGDGDGIVEVWDVQRGICVAKMERPENERPYHLISRLVFSPDSQCLAASSMRDYILYLWHPETGAQLAKFHGETNFRWMGGTTRPVAFSSDGSLLACTMPDASLMTGKEARDVMRPPEHSSCFVAVWHVRTGEQLACLTEFADFVVSLSFSPCDKFLAAGRRNGTVQAWDVSNWQLTRAFRKSNDTRMQVAYSPEGVLHTAGISDDTFTVWNVERDNQVFTHREADGRIAQGECFSSGNQFVFVTEHESEFKVWENGNSQPRVFAHWRTGVPDSLVFSPDGKTLAGGYWIHGVMLWDVESPLQPVTRFKPPGGDYTVSVSANGRFLAIGPDESSAKVWEVGNAETPIAAFTLPDGNRQVTAAAFAPANNLLACGDNEGTVYVWDARLQRQRYASTAHTKPIWSNPDDTHPYWIHVMAFSPNEKLLVSQTEYGYRALLWDVGSGETIDNFPSEIHAVAFSPCSGLIACGIGGGEIQLWDVAQCATVMTLPHAQDTYFPSALAFSPCGKYLASGADWMRGQGIKKVAIRLWRVKDGDNIATFRGHPTDIQALAFSPDGALLASGSYDDTILLWDVQPYLK